MPQRVEARGVITIALSIVQDSAWILHASGVSGHGTLAPKSSSLPKLPSFHVIQSSFDLVSKFAYSPMIFQN